MEENGNVIAAQEVNSFGWLVREFSSEKGKLSSASKGQLKEHHKERERERERERKRERESESESESDPDTREASKGVAVYFQIVRPAKGINIGAKTAHPCHFPAPLPPTEKVTMSSRLYILLLVCLSLRRLERPKENADRVEKEAVECPTSFPAR